MADFATQVKQALADATRAYRLPGVYVSTDGVRATVDVGGGRIPADFCGYQPEVGEGVWVLFVDGTVTLLGPSQLKPGRGTVKTVPANNKVKVTTTAGEFNLPYSAGLSLSVGQKVKLGGWNDGGFVYSVMSTSPPANLPPEGPAPDGADHVVVFTAVDAGSYDTRWWTGQVWASDHNLGIWVFGTKIADTVPDTASILGIDIYISAAQLQGDPPNLAVHAHTVKPAGAPVLGAPAAVRVAPGWNALPTTFGDYLKATAGGIGCAHGGYNIFNSLAADAQSGALRIHWR